MDLIAVKNLQPLGGMLIAIIFIGWFMKESLIKDELGSINQWYIQFGKSLFNICGTYWNWVCITFSNLCKCLEK